jgi:multicomponent K+:H+ antiporter subunit A
MAAGTVWVEDRIRVFPLRWMGIGFAYALIGGSIAFLFGHPFLTSQVADIHLPLIGAVHLSTVLLFDLGVLAIVLGSTVVVLIALAHQSTRTHRKPNVASVKGAG